MVVRLQNREDAPKKSNKSSFLDGGSILSMTSNVLGYAAFASAITGVGLPAASALSVAAGVVKGADLATQAIGGFVDYVSNRGSADRHIA